MEILDWPEEPPVTPFMVELVDEMAPKVVDVLGGPGDEKRRLLRSKAMLMEMLTKQVNAMTMNQGPPLS